LLQPGKLETNKGSSGPAEKSFVMPPARSPTPPSSGLKADSALLDPHVAAAASASASAEAVGALRLAEPVSPTVLDYDRKLHSVEDMMQQTGQERDVCYFYLESANWDVREAVNMYKTFST
jgi:UBA-like domain